MIGIDTNVLVAALVLEDPNNKVILNWLMKGSERFLTTLVNVSELLRLLTHPRVFPNPLTLPAAIEALDELFQAFQIEVLGSEPEWWRECLTDIPLSVSGNTIFDFQIAWTLRGAGVRKIATFDKGFRRFDFIKVVDVCP